MAGLVQEGEHIIVDPSTTAVSVVKALKARKKLTVITIHFCSGRISVTTISMSHSWQIRENATLPNFVWSAARMRCLADFSMACFIWETIAFANNKGGSGKTTTCANVGYSLSLLGRRVLLIDGDMQLNLTLSFFPEDEVMDYACGEKNLYAAMKKEEDLWDYVVHTPYENLDLVPSSTLMSGIEYELFAKWQRVVFTLFSVIQALDSFLCKIIHPLLLRAEPQHHRCVRGEGPEGQEEADRDHQLHRGADRALGCHRMGDHLHRL